MSTAAKRALLVAALLAGAALLGWLWWDGAFLPGHMGWPDAAGAADLDGDGTQETWRVENRRFTVEGQWQSPRGWKVESALTGDIDRDGRPELLLLVWKRGSYGPLRPFWERGADWRFCQHIFIFRWQDGAPQPLWMSSRLAPEAAAWSLEEPGILHVTTPAGTPTRWAWLTWGLTRIDGSSRLL